ncbi:Uncharacterized protein TCM_015989 [Theobroma cacao]|uniref:Uncharacterized protein n=1 Tax=Theobroma cacao TaxID=3641 RepID=A0A061G595_THECC|nr:Uncharacterized protein TCM_015989 [Theobroma cacao]
MRPGKQKQAMWINHHRLSPWAFCTFLHSAWLSAFRYLQEFSYLGRCSFEPSRPPALCRS